MIALIRIRPDRNEARFYRLALWPDLFGDVTVLREWGRIGQPGRMRRDFYPTAAAAQAALDQLRRAKLRSGYVEAAP